MQKKHLLFLLILHISTCLYAQDLLFRSLTVDDGLSQHDVSCILQDSYGFIWIGTYDGLNRYDGFSILNYFHETDNIKSISSNRILSLFEDSKKRIWIGTDGHGLNYYSLITEKFVRVKTPVGYGQIKNISESKTGDILVATSKGVLKIIEDGTIHTEILQLPLTGLGVNAITITENNTIYFATNNGIWTLNDNVCNLIPETETHNCFQVICDKKGRIWATLNGKLTTIKEINNSFEAKEVESFPLKEIQEFYESNDGTIWVNNHNDGLYSFNPDDYSIIKSIKHNVIQDKGLLSNSVLSIYCDRSNTLWIGNRRGLNYTNLSQKNFKYISFSGLDNVNEKSHVRTLYVDREYLYYGILNRGCFQYSFKTKKSSELKTDNKYSPLTINKIEDNIYIGTSNGILIKHKNNSKLTADKLATLNASFSQNAITSICEDGSGNLYFGTFSGLIKRNNETTDWIHYLHPQTDILRGKRIFSLYYDKDLSCIWAGTFSEGLYKINITRDGSFISLEVYNQSMQNNYHITNNTIWSFFKARDGTLWAGTDAGLLRKPKNSTKFSQIKVQGIVDKKIMGIIEDDKGILWLTNSRGLIKFDPNSNNIGQYTYNDGLESSTFTEAVGRDNNGSLYFGSINGINYFNPSEISNNSYKSSVSISDFKIHNISISPQEKYFGNVVLEKSINLTKQLNINHKQNIFLFEFTGTNYTNSKENYFRYKLVGYDKDWIYVTGKRRFASYSNINPGDYTLFLDAANNDGIWSDSPKKIDIQILPAPWLSIWAYIAYIIIASSIIFGFIFFLNNRQKLKHQIELKNIEYNKHEEINELKLMFFTDVAHEFKTPLSLIIGPFNDLIDKKITDKHRDFCYRIISRNTKRMMFLVHQLLDFRKLNANKNILKVMKYDFSEFIDHTASAFLWQADYEGINLNIISPEKLICYFDRDLIEKVIYNLLSNAFKHTPVNGVIEIEVKPFWKKNRQIVSIIIRDSGKGIPDDEKIKIFERYFHDNERASSGIGLHLSNSLIKAHKGELIVSDSSYGGAEFIVSIPVSKNDYSDFEFYKEPKKKLDINNIVLEVIERKKEISEERESIVIVEDDHDLRFYLKNCLQNKYRVIEAQNGVEGLEYASKYLPDIIISDVMMPEMDGIEMCKKIKSNKETSHIPVLMLTAKNAQEQQNEGLEAGAWDYITKPFNTHSLLKKIDNIILSRKQFLETVFNKNMSINIKKHYTSFDKKFIIKAIKIIEENMLNEKFSVEDFSNEVGFSRMQLHRKLKTLVGQSTTEFINTIKINYATKMFDNGCDRINEAMESIGISNYSHFNKIFKKINGKTATNYISELDKTQNFS